jgi:hypothetical protein
MIMSYHHLFTTLAVAVLVTLTDDIHAQFDTTYYSSYDDYLTTRTYFSRKFTTFQYINRSQGYSIRYLPNTTLNFGVGATYKWATLNLAYGFGFLNPDRGRGDTRYLDLQFHSYGRKLTVDVLGQFYKGFYLGPRGKAAASPGEYYIRPDVRINAVGANVQYVLNFRRFSYRAAFMQNEWQRKSAGSALVGIELYAGGIAADSTLIPSAVWREIINPDIQKFRFVEVGANGGYAYTWVYKQHFFLTGALSFSLNAGFNTFIRETRSEQFFGLQPNTLGRISTGFNSSRWSVSFLYVTNSLRLAPDQPRNTLVLNTGNFRLIGVYRFKPSRRLRQYLRPVQEIDENVKEETNKG